MIGSGINISDTEYIMLYITRLLRRIDSFFGKVSIYLWYFITRHE